MSVQGRPRVLAMGSSTADKSVTGDSHCRHKQAHHQKESIMRRHRTGPTKQHYPRSTFQDRRLSFDARGVLLDLLDREDDPTLNTLLEEARARGGKETRADHLQWLSQLEENGYIERDPNATDDDPVATDVYDTRQREKSTSHFTEE